jgi:hypothetical protein
MSQILSIAKTATNFLEALEGSELSGATKATNPMERPSLWSTGYFALLLTLGLSVALVLYYLVFIKPFILLPADILMWAETNFVGDILKIRLGVPIYTAPQDSNSLIYTPGAPLLTYAISWLIGKPTSIIAWRVIQLGFASFAAVIATVCCRLLRKQAYPDDRIIFPKTWLAVTFFAMFLAATAPNTNRFVHSLHTDALALLLSMLSFLTMLLYLRAPSTARLILMAVCPAIGYLTKQFLIGWIAVMFIFLLLQGPRQIKRLALFIGLAAGFLAIAIGACYLIWGDNYIFWTFEVMGGTRSRIVLSPEGHHISLARSVDHFVRSWMEIAIGIVGGLLILREGNVRRLGPLWVAWLVLICSEAVSSGAGWGVLYHFGPGVLIGVIFIFASLPRLWPSISLQRGSELPFVTNWTRALAAFAGVATIFVALQVFPSSDASQARNWRQRPTPDTSRYIADIEREFEGIPADKVLLDVGNWIYLRHSVLANDRAISLGDQPCNGRYENFDPLLSRIRNGSYEKILVRDFHSSHFLYDCVGWPRPSGVKDVLLEHYVEVRTIPAPAGDMPPSVVSPKHAGPVSVFIPRERPISLASTGEKSSELEPDGSRR